MATELANWKIKFNYMRYPSSFVDPSDNQYFQPDGWLYTISNINLTTGPWSSAEFTETGGNNVNFGRKPDDSETLSFDNKPCSANVTFIPNV